MTNKKILLISERFAPDLGGVATSSKRIVDNYCELGAEVHVFSWSKSLPPGQLESVPIATSPGKQAVVHRLGLFGNFDFSMQYSFNIFEWLFAEHDYDFVWGHYLYPSGFIAVMTAELNNKPSIVSARGNDIDRLMFPPGDFARLQWTLERATTITAVSRDLARKIDLILGRDSNTKVLGNTVDVDLFHPNDDGDLPVSEDKKSFFDSTGPILGFCGELRQKKGLPVLLRTFNDLHQSSGAKLLIIGAVRTRENNELTDFLADHPYLSDHLYVTGHLNDPTAVAQFINSCDIMLCPSLWDGIPNSILESMACEKLVVASDAGGISEIVQHEETGFIVSKHSLTNFPNEVRRILSLSEEEKNGVRCRAREYCVNLWESKQHLGILQSIIE